ncbi:putative Melatonin receptor type 1A [Hypsibius exemplaris]|uniref:Melatonin receptor type 1A n=1 Tax=Hypsibius exemplaris TaxID=2072580 RepID=A0A9X6NCL7_HYPEX|nr:putative Melatonin receptor type 1A [Hypsibius exemplaris]
MRDMAAYRAPSYQNVTFLVLNNRTQSESFNDTANETSIETVLTPYLYLEDHFAWMLLTTCVLGLAAFFGTFGNVLIIAAVSCVRNLRTCGNMFVLNLAIADVIITVLVDPFNVVGAVAGRRVLLSNYRLCNIIASFCAPTCLSSMWTMCAISLNRYIFICKPHLYPRIFTYKSTALYCVGIWALSCLLTMPNHIGWGHNRFSIYHYVCSFDMVTSSYAIFFVVTGVLIPLMGVLFGYTAIYLKVRAVKLQMQRHKAARANPTAGMMRADDGGKKKVAAVKKERPKRPGFTREDVSLAKTMFMAFFVFVACWILEAVIVLGDLAADAPEWVNILSVVTAHGNSALNPILYGLTNENFRQGYRTVIGLNCRSVDPAGLKGTSGQKSKSGTFDTSRDRTSVAPTKMTRPSQSGRVRPSQISHNSSLDV